MKLKTNKDSTPRNSKLPDSKFIYSSVPTDEEFKKDPEFEKISSLRTPNLGGHYDIILWQLLKRFFRQSEGTIEEMDSEFYLMAAHLLKQGVLANMNKVHLLINLRAQQVRFFKTARAQQVGSYNPVKANCLLLPAAALMKAVQAEEKSKTKVCFDFESLPKSVEGIGNGAPQTDKESLKLNETTAEDLDPLLADAVNCTYQEYNATESTEIKAKRQSSCEAKQKLFGWLKIE